MFFLKLYNIHMFLFTISLVYTNLLYKVIIYILDSIQYKNITFMATQKVK